MRLLDLGLEFKWLTIENGSRDGCRVVGMDSTVAVIMGPDRIQSFLCNQWFDGEGSGESLHNPATGDVVATASTCGLDLKTALDHCRRTGGPALREMTFPQRAALLERVATVIEQSRESLIESAIVNGGCTRSDAKVDIDGAAAVIHHYVEIGRALEDRSWLLDGEGIQLGRSPRFWGQHCWVPRHGVAVLINAFNFPAWGFAEKAACALLAGVPVLNKPASPTMHTAWLLSKLIAEKADLPEGAYGFLAGEPQNLLDHLMEQDVVAFTGSAASGQTIRRHPVLVDKSVKLTVEADSLNAAVLGPDVDGDSDTYALFVREVVRELTQKAGQKCTAVRRILVPDDRVSQVIEDLGGRLDDVVVGDPRHGRVTMGPLATAAQLRSVRDGVAMLLGSECELAWGDPNIVSSSTSTSPDAGGFFFPPVLLRARQAAEAELVHDREVFGPVATILTYDGSAERACDLVRRGRGGLVTGLYSDDRKFLSAMVGELGAYNGRMYLGSAKMAGVAPGAGLVMPQCIHGGPGRAGGGEELGGPRGIHHYMHRVALQGARGMVEWLSSRAR